MNFAFDEEQRSLGDTVARQLADHPELLAPELLPESGHAAWQSLAELGLFALIVPEEQGGAGLNLVDIALAIEAMGAALAPTGVIETLLATDLLIQHGTSAQQAAWLPQIAVGDLHVAVAMIEEGAGYDAETFTASMSGNRLTGRKLLVTDAAQAGLFLVAVQSDAGPCVVLVPADAKGITINAHEDIDPTSALAEVMFDGVELGNEALLSPASPQRAVERLIDGGATLLSALHVGIAGRMLETSVDYARTRIQFGQPIGAFQTIKHRCADMAVAVEAARSACYYAFWSLSEDAPDRTRAASMAKAYAGEVNRSACNDAIQIHGGMGFTWELGLHRFLRRGKVIEHAFGSSSWHNERVLEETLRMLKAQAAVSREAA